MYKDMEWLIFGTERLLRGTFFESFYRAHARINITARTNFDARGYFLRPIDIFAIKGTPVDQSSCSSFRQLIDAYQVYETAL